MRISTGQRRHDLFQSAPLTDVRGDHEAERKQEFKELFQSAPLTDVRGD